MKSTWPNFGRFTVREYLALITLPHSRLYTMPIYHLPTATHTTSTLTHSRSPPSLTCSVISPSYYTPTTIHCSRHVTHATHLHSGFWICFLEQISWIRFAHSQNVNRVHASIRNAPPECELITFELAADTEFASHSVRMSIESMPPLEMHRQNVN